MDITAESFRRYLESFELDPELQERVDAYRHHLTTVDVTQSDIKRGLLSDAVRAGDHDLIHAYTLFPDAEHPHVVRFVQRALKDLHGGIEVATLITERHIDAYLAIDVAFSGPSEGLIWNRHRSEGEAFEAEVFALIFSNLDYVKATAMLIERRAVQSIAELKEALDSMGDVADPLVVGAL